MRVTTQALTTTMFYCVDPGDSEVLCVPMADNEKDFVKNAREAYRRACPGSTKKRGRPSDANLIIGECETAAEEGVIRPQDSLGKICQVVRERLTEKGSQAPHEDTIRKHARDWKRNNFVLMLQAEQPINLNFFFSSDAVRHRASGFYPWRLYLRNDGLL